MNGWAVRLPRHQVSALSRLWRVPGVRVGTSEGELWLQGDLLDEATDRLLRSLAGAERFSVFDDGSLVPAGRRVPCGWLPQANWQPLTGWLQVALPPSVWAGEPPQPVTIRLVRSEQVAEPAALVTMLESWCNYVEQAPQVRLARWRFAVCRDNRVLICGRPLPSLPGTAWVVEEGIAVPAGWRWQPAVDAEVLRQLFGIEDGDIALLHSDNRWEHVPGNEFVQTTRSAVRCSAGRGTS